MRDKGPERLSKFLESHSSQGQGMPESALRGLRGERGFLPCREALAPSLLVP